MLDTLNLSRNERICTYCIRVRVNFGHKSESAWNNHRSLAVKRLCVRTGVNPVGDAGDTSPQYFGWGTSRGISPQYYYVFSDIADQYWLPSVRSALSRFHSSIRHHQFASVTQVDSRLTRLVPPTLNSHWRMCAYVRAGVWDRHTEDCRGGADMSLRHGADWGTVQVHLRCDQVLHWDAEGAHRSTGASPPYQYFYLYRCAKLRQSPYQCF